MYLPKLSRDKEKFLVIQNFNKSILASIVYIYFTKNVTYREIEESILQRDYKGYQVLNILKYYGLKNEHSNLLKNYTYDECINILKEQTVIDIEYEAVYQLFKSVTYDEIVSQSNSLINKLEKKLELSNNFNLDDNNNLFFLSGKDQEAYFNYMYKIRNKKVQDEFRRKLLIEFDEKCALCDIDEPQLLKASHIIPYSMCSGDLSIAGDSNNGLLLCPIHDSLFESGNYISFSSEGKIIISSKINYSKYNYYQINENLALDFRYMNTKRRDYLEFHRLLFIKNT